MRNKNHCKALYYKSGGRLKKKQNKHETKQKKTVKPSKQTNKTKKKERKKEKQPVDIRLATVETCKTSLLPWKSLELLLPAPIDVPAINSSLFP